MRVTYYNSLNKNTLITTRKVSLQSQKQTHSSERENLYTNYKDKILSSLHKGKTNDFICLWDNFLSYLKRTYDVSHLDNPGAIKEHFSQLINGLEAVDIATILHKLAKHSVLNGWELDNWHYENTALIKDAPSDIVKSIFILTAPRTSEYLWKKWREFQEFPCFFDLCKVSIKERSIIFQENKEAFYSFLQTIQNEEVFSKTQTIDLLEIAKLQESEITKIRSSNRLFYTQIDANADKYLQDPFLKHKGRFIGLLRGSDDVLPGVQDPKIKLAAILSRNLCFEGFTGEISSVRQVERGINSLKLNRQYYENQHLFFDRDIILLTHNELQNGKNRFGRKFLIDELKKKNSSHEFHLLRPGEKSPINEINTASDNIPFDQSIAFIFTAHGSTNKIFSSKFNYISDRELANFILGRVNPNRDIYFLNCCNSFEFIINVLQQINNPAKSPIMVGSSEYGQLGHTKKTPSGSTVFDQLLSLEKPTISDIYPTRKFGMNEPFIIAPSMDQSVLMQIA
ncbi:MAG: hypothetical protein QNJ31_03525 [Candidatus Caenarcaniphilales bacterium]|nr:hypothetical protein [Candidatus Caenarcaniphilales bacterium]